ncbi:helix-turn-helix domain-containing protein [Pelotomaculum propionicicum]|uniref:helix-turn-helix domain-containing protein n=1 Tax=Pelotomaculum propionicicum TaxID=258475 RepID=UPI003B7BE72C
MEIGNTLREARRARGLTLEDVEEETKIRKKYIMALEMEQFEVLPGHIYAKAFLKNYAKFLNLNLDQIMDAFKQKQGIETVHEEHDKPVAEKKVTANKKPPYRLYAAALLLVAAVVVTLVYGAGGLWKNNAAVKEEEPQKTGQILAQDNTGQQQAPDQNNTAAITGVKVDLNIISDRSWIQVIVDGKQEFQGELSAGETRSFEGKENIAVTLGNAGAVEVFENGKSLGFLGTMGAVVNREFKAPASQ